MVMAAIEWCRNKVRRDQGEKKQKDLGTWKQKMRYSWLFSFILQDRTPPFEPPLFLLFICLHQDLKHGRIENRKAGASLGGHDNKIIYRGASNKKSAAAEQAMRLWHEAAMKPNICC